MIVGLDEVGRGAWAGPVVVAAAALEPQAVAGLADSKLLTKRRRQTLAPLIRQRAAFIGIGWVGASLIDRIGMSAALKLAAERAVTGLPANLQQDIIIDGTIRLLEGAHVTTLPKADQLIPSVSAASIIAKVARDTYMEQLAALFPAYGFEQHVGYGTALHRASLSLHGASPVHRLSFRPMTELTAKPAPASPQPGGLAEQLAAEYLQRQGYTILDRNWKTKACEIDLVVQRADTVLFVEVKYRRDNRAGRGLEAITARKQQQMSRAAAFWLQRRDWHGQSQLAAVEVAGQPMRITAFVSNIA